MTLRDLSNKIKPIPSQYPLIKNTMKLDFLHVCEHAMADSSNKISLIGIFNSATVPKLPMMITNFFVVCSFMKEEPKDIGTKNISISIGKKGEEAIATVKGDLVIDDSNENGSFIAKFNFVKFETIGEYLINIKVDDKDYEQRGIKISQQ